MRMRTAALAILALALAAMPAWADWENGPINGTVNAWTINFGFLVSDSYLSDGSTVTGFMIGVWEFPGDTMTSLQWIISSGENGGTLYGSGVASGKNLTDQFISVNEYGYDIDKITVTGLNLTQQNGMTYWLTLQNAEVPSGNPVFWDQNGGIGCESKGCPALASENALGSLPSEAFTINTGGTQTTPEPGSFMLFASGILGLAGVLRRKLF
ncbi:MAG TPA: PEP-CTERM sorting domain-containing protein [Bryobacteraceae bacterium]|nr:PEP-CTERM sorting domain-containing protein [Bryobacteraceae bacterium]